MKHFLLMILYASCVGIIFGVIGRDVRRDQMIYGLKIFIEFTCIGMALAWLLYILPI